MTDVKEASALRFARVAGFAKNPSVKLTKINANRGPMTQFASRAEVVVNECSPLTIESVGHEMVRAGIGGANSEGSRDFAQKAASGAILPGAHGISFQEVEKWQIRRPNSK